jgi:hypothetical protein
VVAVLEDVKMVQDGKDRVIVSGIKGNPPPTTTKVGITAKGGYQAEFHFYFVGLDLEQKMEWTKKQVGYGINAHMEGDMLMSPGSSFYGPGVATADMRVFAQTKDRSLVVKDSIEVPGFNRWVLENFLQSCPGGKLWLP